ncbi:MAG: ribokinase [Chloroflexota bacterium]|nr:ribokinase [Chloroflexota bacterium]
MSIVVFGSINMDLTAYVPKLPQPGETLQGSSYITVPGGKGNNQAVAASRLGAPTHFVGRVGMDGFGEQVLQIVGEQKVDLSQVMKDPQNGTGIAVICVDQNAENTIIIISGANFALDDSDVARAAKVMEDAKVLMLQLEVPLDACLKAAQVANEKGVKVVWDPAPAIPLPDEAFKLMDFITPNETETEILVGFKPENAEDASRAAKLFLEKGVGTAVIKMGARGVYYENKDESGFVPRYKVNPIDTVAAGDAFNAGLAVAISEGKPLAEAVRMGAAAGAIATTRKGALPAMPYREELETLMKEQA